MIVIKKAQNPTKGDVPESYYAKWINTETGETFVFERIDDNGAVWTKINSGPKIIYCNTSISLDEPATCVIADATNEAITITIEGDCFDVSVKKIDTSTNAVSLTDASGLTFDGQSVFSTTEVVSKRFIKTPQGWISI